MTTPLGLPSLPALPITEAAAQNAGSVANAAQAVGTAVKTASELSNAPLEHLLSGGLLRGVFIVGGLGMMLIGFLSLRSTQPIVEVIKGTAKDAAAATLA